MGNHSQTSNCEKNSLERLLSVTRKVSLPVNLHVLVVDGHIQFLMRLICHKYGALLNELHTAREHAQCSPRRCMVRPKLHMHIAGFQGPNHLIAAGQQGQAFLGQLI